MTRIELWGGPADGMELDIPRTIPTLKVPHCPHCAPTVPERHNYRFADRGNGDRLPRYVYEGRVAP